MSQCLLALKVGLYAGVDMSASEKRESCRSGWCGFAIERNLRRLRGQEARGAEMYAPKCGIPPRWTSHNGFERVSEANQIRAQVDSKDE
ncbi:hypothetical protein AZKH_1406 [Azoarcus sp. KH32C]|nr:hypothetical protein AZKH_1406 [Azoarcus sp. KH32C]